jgi:hypothetical protein
MDTGMDTDMVTVLVTRMDTVSMRRIHPLSAFSDAISIG